MAKPASYLAHYQAVQWRGTTPVSDGWICFSFARDAEVLRIRLPVESAHGLVDTAASYLGRWGVHAALQLHGLQPAAVAACAARWFSAAGSHIAFPTCPTDVAREDGSAKAGFLAAAMELRDLLAQSTDGRQALRDLGFEPTCGGEGRGT